MTRTTIQQRMVVGGVLGVLAMFLGAADAQDTAKKAETPKTAPSKPPDVAADDFKTVMTRMQAEKPAIQQRHLDLLKKRYDLGDHPAPGVTMARKKPVQERVRSRLAKELTWEKLAADFPDVPFHQTNLASAYSAMGMTLSDLLRQEEAIDHYQRAIAQLDKLIARHLSAKK